MSWQRIVLAHPQGNLDINSITKEIVHVKSSS